MHDETMVNDMNGKLEKMCKKRGLGYAIVSGMSNSFFQEIKRTEIEEQVKRLDSAIVFDLSSSFIQKASHAPSELIDIGVSYATNLFKKGTNKKSFKRWYGTVSEMNHFRHTFTGDNPIDDFYFLPSKNGALDPSDMKFNGFIFRDYVEEDQPLKSGSASSHNHPMKKFVKNHARGKEALYVKCSVRTDSIGIFHLANHSKFYLQIDSFVFNPKYCNLPNDSIGKTNEPFSFKKRKNIRLTLIVKVYSSWVNQSITYTSDQQLGEFEITANINNRDLKTIGGDHVFIYSPKCNPEIQNSLISVTGESYIVPRSYVGSLVGHVWDTGQYRLDMELSEQCELNEDHYMESAHTGKTKDKRSSAVHDQRKWKKDVWQQEWKSIKKSKKENSSHNPMGELVRTATINGNWIKEIIIPRPVFLMQGESTTLADLYDLDALQVFNPSF